MKSREEIIYLFQENKGLMQRRELLQAGVSAHVLTQLFSEGQLTKPKRGFYKWHDETICVCENEWVEIQKLLPKGVFCLYSAAQYHELSTFISGSYHLAFPKNSSATLPDYPPINAYFWEESVFSIGIEEYEIEGAKVRIYNAERTVCDMLRFKHKVTWETAKECLKTYLRKRNRNLSLLLQYAESFRIKELLNTYLEVLV